jgi:alpha-tubulin suppressor-like RCC1 family protein
MFYRSEPAPVLGLSNVKQIAAGNLHTCAVLGDGTARCWGSNQDGNLGDGTTVDSISPVVVGAASGLTQISAGFMHTCAREGAGSLWCWGDNSSGQVGNGSSGWTIATPVHPTGLADIRSVVTGTNHSCAAHVDGTVSCWGDNGGGQLGIFDALVGHSASPVTVSLVSGVSSLAAGSLHTCALKSDGTVSCFGSNVRAQLGDGTLDYRTTAVTALGVTGAVSISASDYRTCAASTDGSVRCWGDTAAPSLVAGLSDIKKISVGSAFTCALDGAGRVWCWSSTAPPAPALVAGLSGVVDVSSGKGHVCAVLSSGSAQCWGTNSTLQLGDGSATFRVVPYPIAL